MASIKAVQNKKNMPPSTSGFPKAVQNNKASNANKGTTPAPPYKKGGAMKKGKMC